MKILAYRLWLVSDLAQRPVRAIENVSTRQNEAIDINSSSVLPGPTKSKGN